MFVPKSEIITKLSANVPRYTSYPTAPNFSPDLGPQLVEKMHASIDNGGALSIYIHIPYCDRLCWFCGCHTKQTKSYIPISYYVETLLEEIELHRKALAHSPEVAHIHFGGGSPSMLKSEDFNELSKKLRTSFRVTEKTEISVEIDPNDMSDDMLVGLQKIGITRASIGVQDFDPDVQEAINRPQTFEQTRDLIEELRSINISSINVDALYGLPRQDMNRLNNTLEKVISLSPDRVAMFGYAHVPWLKKHQNMINDQELPNIEQRHQQADFADQFLTSSGLQKIGIDHYATPEDSLTKALNEGTLHRNFQGYTTDQCNNLLGLGASSINQYDGGFIQNTVPTKQYKAQISEGKFAANRGYELTQDDRIRGYVIERLMCDFSFNFDDVAIKFGDTGTPIIETAKSVVLQDSDDLCWIGNGKFNVSADKRAFTRIVASKFDAYLSKQNSKFSKPI
ncbi:oxygen-independent coproporphyrinogen III oxidase [Lentilitoribacter sp. EG35]|uniref:oxygen-independent coproporphyrinogen III oxidase n=1 Tax=Lentilitoribacter sp. EG35 TaxID=3234192 RepID=UPI0034603226